MKTNKSFYALCLAIVAGTLTMLGQQQPQQLLPIKSQDTLREYALGHVVRGFRDVSASSMVGMNNQPNWVEARGSSAEEVLDRLFGAEIVYSLANSNDTIEGRVWLYDAFDNLLFFGSARYTASAIGKVGPSYNIWMQSVPLLEKVSYAEVLVLNPDGVTVRHLNLDTDQKGHLLFNQYLAGVTNGILSVRFQDGSVVTYQLWNPVGEKPATVSESGPSWQIEGHHVYQLTEKDVLLVNFIEPWALPTVLLEVKANQQVKFDVMGLVQQEVRKSFERPLSFTFTQVDGPWAGAGPIFPDQPTVIQLPGAGKFRIRFEWQNFGKPGMLYAGPDDGGKG